ncbi:hypothetical protein D3C75_1315740 [compost metagenome]
MESKVQMAHTMSCKSGSRNETHQTSIQKAAAAIPRSPVRRLGVSGLDLLVVEL